MLELLSLVFGGVLRLAPEVLGFFKAKNDQAHEHRMTLLQLDIDKARAQQALDLAHAQHAQAMDKADMDALVAALQAQAAPSGVRWIDALSSSVRPVLTYWHAVVLFTAHKVAVLQIAMLGGVTWQVAVTQGFGEFDRMLVGSIFAFWFVDRSLRGKAR
ncbi:MAG: hypothetical protein L6Q68_02550 [Aquabacterium sp.]|nr:hypothetical protein [Aquabacterium sp.]